ncbi:zinc finger protein 106-like [Xenia sp. Carnegie-2017]|uniref:zinc finger protein 106-like n=1 Tax=Xenia sp. Carnegie-2017 TaxID=2897299 RepID=UPI001F040EFE|nr:zinc finger protein 106-like [Xenia sp. Carnegie-2017]
MYTGSSDQTVCAYDIKSGSCTYKFSFRGRVMCLHVAFGKLFVGLSSGYVTVVDLKTNECIDQFNCHVPNKISCLSSGTEGQRSLLCTGSFDATITIRDQMTGLLIRHIKDHKLTVLCMQVVENVLYSGSADTVVRSHNINTGELLRSYSGHTMSVSGLQALGGVLVTSSLDKIVRCYDIETGELLQLYGGNTNMIFSLCVLGNMIYTGCRDGRLSSVKLDLRKYHSCKWRNCSLKFGVLSHFKQHVEDHINETVNLKDCFWRECLHTFFGHNQSEVIQEAKKHILSHVQMA